MRTFIELKKISLEKEHVETKDFPESGFYKLHRKGKVESNDFVYVDKNFPHVMFICSIDVLDKLNLKIPEEELFFKFAGLNHFHWHRVWDKTGEEKSTQILKDYPQLTESGLKKILYGITYEFLPYYKKREKK